MKLHQMFVVSLASECVTPAADSAVQGEGRPAVRHTSSQPPPRSGGEPSVRAVLSRSEQRGALFGGTPVSQDDVLRPVNGLITTHSPARFADAQSKFTMGSFGRSLSLSRADPLASRRK